ncbi:beta-1,4-glucuronyltransferase 1-like [Papilio machaon]|uniref:beta-1,4-glucuronyltransferase 1-like n=1 Tax=Papilio machaon TaxID=76193 RepID=UPI001E6637B2|nr:beta-1,4-glucuronyltransferase 1-like [Papilio machaon]
MMTVQITFCKARYARLPNNCEQHKPMTCAGLKKIIMISYSKKVYEMFLIGYQFRVLSPIFTIHWGLQARRSRPLWREKQNEKNRKHFETFKRELFARYRTDPLHLLRRPPQRKA